MDDNLFDEDEALDYVLYEESEKEVQNGNQKGGCLGMILLALTLGGVIPAAGGWYALF